MKCLTESDVGITSYTGNHKGFSGVIKQRFSDFHVNEIDLDGNIIKLTDILPPKSEPSIEVCLENDILSPEVVENLDHLLEKGEPEVEIEVTQKSKEERLKIHEFIRKKYKCQFVSNTKDKNGKKLLIVNKPNKSNKQDNRQAWPAERGGEYLHFVMFKENKDTMEAVNIIAHKLRMRPNFITYAGTKDRRGKTSQMISVKKVEPSRIASISKELKGITLGNYSFKPMGLKLGDLSGNHFRIALRNVSGSEEEINSAMKSLGTKGFINYYGLQRFGNSSDVPTHMIGKNVLLRDWKKTVELILQPRENESRPDLKAARKVWSEKRNAKEAYKQLTRGRNTVEGKLFQGLQNDTPYNFLNAFESLPRNMRLFYQHSYQSLIWNKVASRRIETFGLKPIVGDLILKEHVKGISHEIELAGDSIDCVSNSFVEESALASEHVTNDSYLLDDAKNELGQSLNPELEKVGKRPHTVEILTEESVKSARIEDIVLPLPGYDVVFPHNVMKDWYEELLKEDGLSSITSNQQAKSYALSGSYRRLLLHPKDLSWRAVHYPSPEDILILSDLEKMHGEKLIEDNPDGKNKALIVEFSLPSSTYATMLLREIMKQDTSSGFQTSLNPIDTSSPSNPNINLTTDLKYETEKCIKVDSHAEKRKPEDCEFEQLNGSKKCKQEEVSEAIL
uniref:(California timema) hypothetical protein n=1 Tax=Timema californicum TaxID=61474 RepID=A0A7R9JCJ7_TIMCA|nr:unnamed protein product [Timema californicum]